MRTLRVVAAAVAVLVTGCEEGGSPASGKPAAGDAKPAAGTPKVAVAIYQFDNTFMSYVRRTIEETAKGKAELNIVDSQNQQPTQNDQVDQFLVQGFKVMAINPVDRTAVSVIVAKAKARNVPVVFFIRERT